MCVVVAPRTGRYNQPWLQKSAVHPCLTRDVSLTYINSGLSTWRQVGLRQAPSDSPMLDIYLARLYQAYHYN